jgi:DNA-directed RNA polymerase subunit alpha
MLQPTFTITAHDESDNFARLVLEPLEKGYGHTLGVSLRRVMLSSIYGASVTKVRIEGVQHQFSTLEGMTEDITEFILNLKQLNFRLDTEEDEITLRLDATKAGIVTGHDIQLPAQVTLANPDHELAVLSGKNKLNAEITITRGLGYSASLDRVSSTVGEIPVDAAFSPVRKVAYKIEATRVGRRTDYDRLIMDVWTDGTMSAREALTKAAEILVSHFKQVYDPVIINLPKEESLEDKIENEILKLTVEELDLPTRIANALRKGGYATVKDLTRATRDEISKVKNLGGKSVDSVADALVQKELSFANENEE